MTTEMRPTLPEIPDEAAWALLHEWSPYADEGWGAADLHRAKTDLSAAWPYLYAAALNDYAERLDKIRPLIGHGDDPFRFVAASLRMLAHDASAAAYANHPANGTVPAAGDL